MNITNTLVATPDGEQQRRRLYLAAISLLLRQLEHEKREQG
jgi:hypothetical protein